MERMWALGGFDGFRQKHGCTQIYPGSPPRRVKTYILLVWSCIAGICGAVTMVRRCNLVKVEEDGVASLCTWDLCEISCLCEISLCEFAYLGAPLVALYMQPVRVYK
jgi:hypothetical protein